MSGVGKTGTEGGGRNSFILPLILYQAYYLFWVSWEGFQEEGLRAFQNQIFLLTEKSLPCWPLFKIMISYVLGLGLHILLDVIFLKVV
jgi:hypothetical protein